MLSLVTTSDGSHTIKNETTGDTYHSIHGAVQESQHVFIKNGLLHYVEKFSSKKIHILEIGLGSGLNALLTYKAQSQLNSEIEYTALEPFPLEEEFYRQLNYDSQKALQTIHKSEWENPIPLSGDFTLFKSKAGIQSVDLPHNHFDVVYFDAFAPNSQPEMWTLDIFSKLRNCMRAPSVLTTYCAKGEVKRTLKAAGFTIESLPGPPGKREMVRAMITSN